MTTLIQPSQEDVLQLNPEQKEAIHHGDGPLLIIAGAGAGKTSVITQRIVYLIKEKKVRPEEILALTFTEKAAAEMEERVDILVPFGATGSWISTFHAFGDRVLREHSLELGLTSDFKVLSKPEQIIFFCEHLFEFPLRYYRPLGNPTKHIEALLTIISRAKDEDIGVEEYLKHAERMRSKAETEGGEYAEIAAQQTEVANTYKTYQEILMKEGMIDFGDQVNLPLKLFRGHPAILKRYQGQFKYILVDEFQDTNYAQFQLVRLLAERHRNITVVGDDDQSIYKFRGAAISNILNFMKCYPDAKQVVLTENYRSTQLILDAAYRLIINNNPERLEEKNKIDKKLRGGRTGTIPATHFHYDTVSSEADAVAQMVKEKASSNDYKYRDIAVLVRSNNDAEPFLRAFNMHGIPHIFSGSRGLYSRIEIKLLIAFLRAIADPANSMYLFYLAGSDIYQMNMIELTLCSNIADRKNLSLYHVFTHLDKFEELSELSSEAKAAIAKIIEDINKYITESRDISTGRLLYNFLTNSGLLKRLSSSKDNEDHRSLQNIAKFFEAVKNFEHLSVNDRVQHYIKHLDMLIEAGDNPAVAEADIDEDAVSVMTVHKSKGLEFPVVFMVSLVNLKFPTKNFSDPIELPQELIKDIVPSGDFHIQEERRLFYVGMTRAKEELCFTSSRDYGGAKARKVSPFVVETLNLNENDLSLYKASALEEIRRFAPSIESNSSGLAPMKESEMLKLNCYQIDDYNTCPLKFKYLHILRIPLYSHHAVIYGSALHTVVAEYFKRKKLGIPVSFDDIKKIYESSWKSEGFLSKEHEEIRFNTGIEALKRFFEKEEKAGILPTYIEKEFNFFIGKNKITGRWDRVDENNGTGHIIDYKSSEVKDQKTADEKTRKNLQLSIYALAYREIHGRLPDRVHLYFLESGIIGSAEPKEKDIEKTIEKINTVAAGIRQRIYAAKPDYNNCEYCAYQNICTEHA
ncbi:MAG: ATP-dependent DNA helicase [Nitrospirota bacterium]